MSFRFLTKERIASILSALAPRFIGRDQDHLLGLADEAAGAAYDIAFEHIEPLEELAEDLQSPAGASLIGSTGPSNVQADLDSLAQQIVDVIGGQVIDSIADGDTTHAPSRNAVFDALALKAPLASPAFTGNPTAPTPVTADNDTSIATTAFVKAQGYTTNTGTVTSVGAIGSTGLTISGSPITTSGSITYTLSANLQAWSGLAPSSKADDSAVVHLAGTETISGAKILNTVSFNTALGVRQMIDFWTNTYAMGIQNNTMYFRTGTVASTGGGFAWYRVGTYSVTAFDPGAGGDLLAKLDGTGVFTTQGRIVAGDSTTFVPSTTAVANASFRTGGAFGGGNVMIDGAVYGGTWMEAGVYKIGVGTSAGLGWSASFSNATEEHMVVNGRMRIAYNGISTGLWLDNSSGTRAVFMGLMDDNNWGYYNIVNGWATIFKVDGRVAIKNANSSTITTQPRIFVQSADPGAAAADGDLWFW